MSDINNFIIVAFPRFAGGKFIMNCLSLSKFCCPQDPVVAEYLLTHPDDYNYRFNAIMKTLPETREEMINWVDRYEFGDYQLYQHMHTKWNFGIKCEPNDLVNRLLDSGFHLFLTSHGGEISIRNLATVWPNAKIIQIINHVKFSKIAHGLKCTESITLDQCAGNYCRSKYTMLAGHDWPSWEEFESVGYNIQKLSGYELVADEILSFYNWRGFDNDIFLFNIDESIFNRSKFLASIELLYKSFGFSDFNSELVGKFWQSYMSLHVDNVDLT